MVADVLAWAVIGRFMVRASSFPFALAMLTIHLLTVCHRLAPDSAANWSKNGSALCYHMFVIMHVKDP